MSFASKSHPVSRRIRKHSSALRRVLVSPEDSSIIELLDRILDHGIVVEPSARLRLQGLKLSHALDHLVLATPDTSS